MKRNLAIIGASYLQLPLIEKAKELGYTTHVFAWAANDVGESAADYFYPISVTEIDKIARKCREIGICGICSIATDLGNITVNYVANMLGLPSNSIESTRKSTNKHLMRATFEACGDPSPKSIQVDAKTDLTSINLSYPIIVKPTDRSGSRGVFKLDAPDGLEEAVNDALSKSYEKKVMIEEFVEGEEYSIEGITYQGNHNVLAITQKYTTGAPHFIETGHLEPAPITKETYKKIEHIVIHALTSLEITNSASHTEIKIDNCGDIKIIEIGARMGGDCIGSDLVKYSTGIDYLKAVIDVSCGIKPDLSRKGDTCSAEVRYIINQDDLKEFERVKTEEADRILRIVDDKHLDLIGKATDSSNRAGCYIVRK